MLANWRICEIGREIRDLFGTGGKKHGIIVNCCRCLFEFQSLCHQESPESLESS